MSFSYSVKEEIEQSVNNNQKARACLYGMLLFCKDFNASQITLLTENLVVAELFKKLVGQAVDDENAVEMTVTNKKNNVTLYTLKIEKPSKRKALFDYYGFDYINISQRIEIEKIGKQKFLSFFVAGAFLACGSVNDPLKEYHLEFVIPTAELCSDMSEILGIIDITPKMTERKNSHILYLKESENIEDILTYMGAPKSSLEIMNVKILKDVRNKINRAVNCDSANIEKTLRAAEKQIEDINIIEKSIGLSSLPDELREIAELRLENPDWNLKELGENTYPPISRSGANHRLTKISKIAEEYK